MAKIAAAMAGGADKAEASQAELVAEHGADLGAVGTLKEQIAMAVGQAREGGVEEQDILSVLEEAEKTSTTRCLNRRRPRFLPMIHTYLYDANGHDREVNLDDQCVAELGEHNIWWVDVEGRDASEIEAIAGIFKLDPTSVRELLKPQEALYLDKYEAYFQFDVIGLAYSEKGGERALRKREPAHLEFLVGARWIITVREGTMPFLQGFRDQDKGETLIGALSPPALVASLLDWHLTTYFEAVTELEAFVDRLDEAMLGRTPRGVAPQRSGCDATSGFGTSPSPLGTAARFLRAVPTGLRPSRAV